MFSNSSQFASASKSLLEFQLNALSELTNITVQGVQEIIALNTEILKEHAAEAAEATKKFLAAKDMQAFLAVATEHAKPQIEKISAYQHHFSEITSSTKRKLSEIADTKVTEVQGKINELLKILAKTHPIGAESAGELLKSAAESTSDVYEKTRSATKQAVDNTVGHLEEAAGHLTKVVDKHTSK